MKSVIVNLFLILLFATTFFAQSTTIKLPTTNSSSSFDITNSNNDILLRLYGDGGFYLGNCSVGTSIAMGWNTTAGGFNSTAMGTNTSASGGWSTAMGYNSNASGDYSTALGFEATSSGNYSVSIGYHTTASRYYSTALGYYTSASAANSTAMGNYVSTGNFPGSFVLGDNSTTTVKSASYENQLTMRFDNGYDLLTNSGCTTGVYIGHGGNGWSNYSDSTKKENFVKADGEYFLSSLSKLKLGSWNYKVQDPKEFRHYGPMAQEIFHYFGKDEYGVIGNDTLLATTDMDGIMMICLQALEKRTSELQNAEEKIARLEKALEDFSKQFVELKKAVANYKEENKATLTVTR